MARNNTSTRGKSAKKKTSKTVNTKGASEFLQKVLAFVRSPEGRKSFALVLMLMGAFMLIAFVSHFFTGYKDQSMLQEGGEAPRNWLGSIGAWVSQLFVNRGFGLMSILIAGYVGLLGFAILENKYYAFVWKIFKHLIFAVLWGSAFLTFLSVVLWKAPSVLGGGFGWYLNETFFGFIGRIGMGLLLVVVMLIYLVVNFNMDLPISKFFQRKKEEAATGQEGQTAADGNAEGAEGQAESGDEKDANSSGETEDEDPEEDDDDFVVSVRTAEREAETTDNSGSEEDKAASKDKVMSLNQISEPSLVEEEPKDKVDTQLEVQDDGSVDLEVSLPTPDQIPDIPTGREGGLELVVEERRPDDAYDDQGPDPEDPIEDGDNIQEVEDDKFEKIIPENSEETLEDGEDLGDWEDYDPTLELSAYQYPTIDLLEHRDGSNSREVNRSELEENKNKIVQTLQHYKIDITSIKATIGPTVTLYEIVPAPGVRISKIRNLEDDIALSLAALGIRIIAPIPGKGTIGIEIPNSNPEVVSMRSVMATEKFRNTKAELPLVLGRTISNEVFIADLAKMPHLLIAGATGQGKSVGINGIVSSILYRKHPAQVKFVLIDPKKVELSLYSKLERHFLAKLEGYEDPIITDTKQVIHVLNSLCKEMDSRYDLLKKAKVRNLKEYNAKFTNRKLNPRKGHRFMPYIVLIIDEFADLMMTAGKEIEAPIARLAQLARAIGIHLILATQRPSVNVITGIIKANFPARISYRVTSKVDSRTILDTGGADQLIGRGDMLLSTGSEIVRIQNAFIDTPEVDSLVDFIGDQRGYPHAYYLPEVPMEGEDDGPREDDLSDRDELFDEAARLVVKHQQGSTSLIQRRLSLGYNRAGRLIDQLESAGIVGPFVGSKAREVLVQDEYALEQILNELP